MFCSNFQFHPSFRSCCSILFCTNLISTIGKTKANKKIDHRHSGRIRRTENNTQCFSRKNANTNDESETSVHVISHLQVSQIPKIKSKKGTGTWNPSRMTTFQGQSAKRHSNKNNFKSGLNQPNPIFIFITFRNPRQKILMLFHIYKFCRFRKSNQKRAPKLGIPAECQHSKVSRRNVTQTRTTSKAVKINQMLAKFKQNSFKILVKFIHLHQTKKCSSRCTALTDLRCVPSITVFS